MEKRSVGQDKNGDARDEIGKRGGDKMEERGRRDQSRSKEVEPICKGSPKMHPPQKRASRQLRAVDTPWTGGAVADAAGTCMAPHESQHRCCDASRRIRNERLTHQTEVMPVKRMYVLYVRVMYLPVVDCTIALHRQLRCVACALIGPRMATRMTTARRQRHRRLTRPRFASS